MVWTWHGLVQRAGLRSALMTWIHIARLSTCRAGLIGIQAGPAKVSILTRERRLGLSNWELD